MSRKETRKARLPDGTDLKITVHAKSIAPFPEACEITIYAVEIGTSGSAWFETFVTEVEIRAFLRGFQAGSQMTGGPYIPVPGIPQGKL